MFRYVCKCATQKETRFINFILSIAMFPNKITGPEMMGFCMEKNVWPAIGHVGTPKLSNKI